MRFWIEYKAQRLELHPGAMVIGRGPTCDLVLDDALVSRRHAQITLAEQEATLEDCGSINGVYLNERRVTDPQRLAPGDRIVIGKQQMVFRSAVHPGALAATHPRVSAETLHGFDSVELPQKLVEPIVPPDDRDEQEHTSQGHAIELLSGVVDKALALGRGAEAERILSSYLASLLEEVASGSAFDVKAAENAVAYAVKLAAATGKAQWVDYAVELYHRGKRPLPGMVVDELYLVLRKVGPVNLSSLRTYVAMLREAQNRLSPAERFVAQRIEGLAKLAALK
jgi:hypothetical protein